MSWFVLAILAMLALAVAELTQQHLLTREQAINERASAVLTFLTQWLLSIPVILVFYSSRQVFGWFTPTLIASILINTVLASVSMVFYLRSFRVKNISFSNIFGATSVPVSAVLGIAFLNEGNSWIKLAGILLILVAIVSLNYKNIHLEKNHFFALISGLLFGIAYTIDKGILRHMDPIIYIFWSFLLVGLFGFLFNPREVLSSLKGKRLSVLKPIILSAVGYFIFNFLTFSAYRAGGDVGSVDAINNSVVFVVILFEFIVMRHRHSLVRKIVTAVIAYSGILLLGLAH